MGESTDSYYDEFSVDESEVSSRDTGIAGIVDVQTRPISPANDAIKKEIDDRKIGNRFESKTVDFTETADISGERPRRQTRRPRKYADYSTQFANTQYIRRIRREIVSDNKNLRLAYERPSFAASFAESRSPADIVQATVEVPKLCFEYIDGVKVAGEQLLEKFCRDNSLGGELGFFNASRSLANPTLSNLILSDTDSYSPVVITPTVQYTDSASISVARCNSFSAMACTKQTIQKQRNEKKTPGTQNAKDFACFVCSFKTTLRHNYLRHLARCHKRKEDGTHADAEYCEKYAKKRPVKKVPSSVAVDTDSDVEPSTPPCLKYVRRIKEARNKTRVVQSASHIHESSPKINLSDKNENADPGDAIQILSDGENAVNEFADETAQAVANIPGLSSSISGICDILSQGMEREPLFEVGVSTEELLDLIGDDTRKQTLDDIPLGLGWMLDDNNGVSAFSVKQRPVFTNREDMWTAPVSAESAVPTQVHEVTCVVEAVPLVVNPVVQAVASNVVDPPIRSTARSFGCGVSDKSPFSVVNKSTEVCVAKMSNGMNQITVQAEVHSPPRVVKNVVRSKVSRETRNLQTGAIADITAARIKHVTLSPDRDSGPCVRRHSVPLNPAPKPRSRSLERPSVAVEVDKFAAALTGSDRVKPQTKTRKAETKNSAQKDDKKVDKKADTSKKVEPKKQKEQLPTKVEKNVEHKNVVAKDDTKFLLLPPPQKNEVPKPGITFSLSAVVPETKKNEKAVKMPPVPQSEAKTKSVPKKETKTVKVDEGHATKVIANVSVIR